MKQKLISIFCLFLAATAVHAGDDAWVTHSQEDWETNSAKNFNLTFKDGMVEPTAERATFTSVLKKFGDKRKATSIILEQSPIWQNWNPVENIGPANLSNSPIFLQLGPDNYWMFGRYKDANTKKKGKKKGNKTTKKGKKKTSTPKDFVAKDATLEGFDIPLKTTRWKNQYDSPGGISSAKSGYHAWQSRDMKNWVHHGAISDEKSDWMTNAEYADGKAYFYYDFPNDQDPHLIIDSDLADGKPGTFKGMVFKDPSHGSDAGIIRDLEGNFHLIVENWDPINASERSWDSPLASHAVSANGIDNFKIVEPAVDERTTSTGKKGSYKHPSWAKEDPENYKSGLAEYDIHEPAQEAYGDWATIAIGGQYYLFGDYDPAGAHGQEAMSVCWFTSDSIDKTFSFCDHIGEGHPDPGIIFAEGQFYLATQMKTDYISPGPWVESVEVRVGVDTDNDQKIDQWTDWKQVKESYDYIKGFAKQIAKKPAQLDLSSLPEGYGFQYEIKLTDTTDNKSKPIIDTVSVNFE